MSSPRSASPKSILEFFPNPTVANGFYDSYRNIKNIDPKQGTGTSSTDKVSKLKTRMEEIEKIESIKEAPQLLAAWIKLLDNLWEDLKTELANQEGVVEAVKSFFKGWTAPEHERDLLLKTTAAIWAYVTSKLNYMLQSAEIKEECIENLKHQIKTDQKKIHSLRDEIQFAESTKKDRDELDEINDKTEQRNKLIIKLVKLGDPLAIIWATKEKDKESDLLPAYRKLADAKDFNFNTFYPHYLQPEFHHYYVKKIVCVVDTRNLGESNFKKFEENLISGKRSKPIIPGGASVDARATQTVAESKSQASAETQSQTVVNGNGAGGSTVTGVLRALSDDPVALLQAQAVQKEKERKAKDQKEAEEKRDSATSAQHDSDKSIDKQSSAEPAAAESADLTEEPKEEEHHEEEQHKKGKKSKGKRR